MVVKYCEHCFGRPYTTDLQVDKCPKCGKSLGIESADESELEDRAQLVVPQSSSSSYEDYNYDTSSKEYSQKDNEYDDSDYSDNLPAPENGNKDITVFRERTHAHSSFVPEKYVRGRVAQYSSSGKEDGTYRRLLPVKIYQAIVYRQRLEDVLHRFTVRVEQGEDALGYQKYTDVPVNVHGTIASGMQIINNAEVKVHGKYHNGVLMADSIYIINNNYESKVGFQRSVKAIAYAILSAVMLAFICFVAVNSNGGFFANIKEFCTVWLVMAAIITVLYLVLSFTRFGILTRLFSRGRRSFPLVGILLLSLALAFLFVNAFGSFAGFGSYLSGWLNAVIPLVITVVVLFFIIKAMIVG